MNAVCLEDIIRMEAPAGPFCSDRSFISLSDAAGYHADGPQGFLVGAVIGILLVMTSNFLMLVTRGFISAPAWPVQYLRILGVLAQIWKLVPDPRMKCGSVVAVGLLDWLLTDGLSHSHGTMALIYLSMTAVVLLVQLLLPGEVLGVVLWYSGALKKVAPALVRALGWEMDQVGHWGRVSGKKLLVTHPGDGIIPPEVSLYTALSSDPDRDNLTVVLRHRWPNMERVNPQAAGQRYHNYNVAEGDISTRDKQWDELHARVSALLN